MICPGYTTGVEAVGIVAILALGQYFAFAFAVAGLREQRGIAATEPCDDETLNRAVRVHANTGEMLIVFLPLLGICAHFLHPWVAAGTGAFWIVARAIYRRGYLADVKSRIPGFIMGDVVLGVLALGSLYGITRNLVSG
ncbi:MAG: MAPEG family protein [Myxococcota bacterium]